MSRIVTRGGAAVLAALLLFLVTAAPAFAHQQRQVGAYQFTVGWKEEPTYTATLNAVQLFLHDASGEPVDDIGDPPTLTVTVTTGTPPKTSAPLELEPSFDADTGLGTHGEFDAAIIPTAPGTYSFHFTGTVNGQSVDQTFTSSDSTFANVQDPTSADFPVAEPSGAALAAGMSRLGPRVDGAVSASQSAKEAAHSATILAIVAFVVGGVLGAAGVVVGISARRHHD